MSSLLWTKNKAAEIYDISNGRDNTITSLEGLRAIAAFMVFIVHYCAQFTPWINQQSLTWEFIVDYRFIGSKGVELFFVISGFLIYGMLINKEIPFLTYFKRRIRRLYPTFLVMLALYMSLSFVFENESKLPNNPLDLISYIIANILMLPGIFEIKPIMTVAWSLSYEIFLYLCMPLIIYSLNLRRWKSKSRIYLLSTVTIIGFVAIFFGYDSHNKMILFLSGMLFFELKDNNKLHENNQLISFSFISTIIAALLVKHTNTDNTFILLTLFIGFFFTFSACLDVNSIFSKLCSTTLLRYFGNMSYSYYLIHGITLKAFFLLLSFAYPPSGQWTLALYYLFIPVFILTWIVSTILFVGIEKPLSLIKTNHRKLSNVSN